jgi:hypothetical protein
VFGTFPYEPEPDGAVFGPHHFYLGVLLILLVCWLNTDPESENSPWVVVGVILLSVFSFSLTWPYYPAVGALGVLVTLGIATASAVIRPFWWRSGVVAQSSLLVGLYVAWDDALSHALGWRTPLDAVWAEFLYPYASNPYVPSTPRLPTLPESLSGVRVPTEVRLPTDADLLADLEALFAEHVADALAVVAL